MFWIFPVLMDACFYPTYHYYKWWYKLFWERDVILMICNVWYKDVCFVDVYRRNCLFMHQNILMNLRRVLVSDGHTTLNQHMIGALWWLIRMLSCNVLLASTKTFWTMQVLNWLKDVERLGFFLLHFYFMFFLPFDECGNWIKTLVDYLTSMSLSFPIVRRKFLILI